MSTDVNRPDFAAVDVVDTLQTVVVHNIADIPAERLSALCATGLYESARWLAYCERAPGSQMMYVTLEDAEGRLRGLSALRQVDDPRTMHLSEFYARNTGVRPGADPTSERPNGEIVFGRNASVSIRRSKSRKLACQLLDTSGRAAGRAKTALCQPRLGGGPVLRG